MYKQYQQRGSLSKKQLQGLFAKASEIKGMQASKLATLEAIIRKMPNRYKSEAPAITPVYTKDPAIGEMIDTILAKYPQHKQVLFLQSKYLNNEVLSPADLNDLKRFKQAVDRKS